MLVVVYVAAGLYLAMDAGRWDQLVFLVLFLPALALFVGPMAALGAAARWVLARRWPPNVAVSMVIGALTGPVALFLIFATGDVRILTEPARAGLDSVFSSPMVLGGAVAGWLAEREVSPRRAVWWAMTLGVAILGLALLEPVGALFPPYGAGIPSWPPG